MYDNSGRKVLEEAYSEKTIDVCALPAGFYFWVAVKSDGSTANGKWIKE